MLVGIAWYTRENYPEILKIMRDAADLHETFDQWEETTREMEDELNRRGMETLHVMIKPDLFVEWCSLLGMEPDSAARLKFVTESAQIKASTASDGNVIGRFTG